MKLRKPGNLEHPTWGSGQSRVVEKRAEGQNHVLHQSLRLRVEATDLLLECPKTRMAAQAAHALAKRSLKAAYSLNKTLEEGVLVSMLDVWPFASAYFRQIGLHPLQQRYSARHAVWHESGHLAHAPHEIEELEYSVFRRVFHAWRIEARKRVMPKNTTEMHASYVRYLVNTADESKARTNRRLPAIWRKTKASERRESLMTCMAADRCNKYVRGWQEFLAEAYLTVYMPGELQSKRYRRYQSVLELHFPESLKAYRKALVDDRRVKQRVRSSEVAHWVNLVAEMRQISLASGREVDEPYMALWADLMYKDPHIELDLRAMKNKSGPFFNPKAEALAEITEVETQPG